MIDVKQIGMRGSMIRTVHTPTTRLIYPGITVGMISQLGQIDDGHNVLYEDEGADDSARGGIIRGLNRSGRRGDGGREIAKL